MGADLIVRPLTLKQANDLVAQWHRHHKPCVGHRFSIGVLSGGEFVGAAITGRPVARMVDWTTVAEVTRLVTNGTDNACSKLYSAAARAAQAMGFVSIQTYILAEELGTSLKAAGWVKVGDTAGGNWSHGQRKGLRREDQPMGAKQRWERILNPPSKAKAQPPPLDLHPPSSLPALDLRSPPP